MSYVRPLDTFGRADVALAGGKGANLGELIRAGQQVPPGFVLTTDAYLGYVSANDLTEEILELATQHPPADAAEQIRALFAEAPMPVRLHNELIEAYQALGRPPVAVRSSATAEDLAEASFAGQQDTFLNVRGEAALARAVQRCWASLWTARAISYRARQGIDPSTVSLAVVVQQMVPAEAAGVLFTANPTNGRRGEAVISAAWGLGESVVGGTVNTDDLVVVKADGRVLARTTADKAVMTSYAVDGTAEVDVPAENRRIPVLDDSAAAELTRIGSQIEEHFGAPQDIEWARADNSFYVVQSRPITALPEQEVEAPSDWSVPEPGAMYVRGSIVEQLPDPLTPLFADLVDGSVTRSLQALFAELTGRGVIRDTDVSLPTVNGYAYYRYDNAGMARLMLHSGGAFKMLFTPNEHGLQARWRNYAHPRYEQAVARWRDRAIDQLSAAELVAGVSELLDAGTEYYTSVQTIIPIAATSEVFFTRFYDRLVRREGDPPAATFLLGYDSLPIRSEKSLYDLAGWARSQPGLAEALLAAPTDQLVAVLRGEDPLADEPAWAEWRRRFQAHLDAYGHTIYNLDFVNAVPADDPAPLLETMRFYLRGEGSDPYARQEASAARREQETQTVLGRLDPARARAFTRLLRWAQRVGPVREDALGDIGLAWPQMRRMLDELGRRLVAAGVLSTRHDVYWLTRGELLSAAETADSGQTATSLTDVIGQRQQLWRGQRRATPPQLLPENSRWMRVFGNMLPATTAEQSGDVLTGIGASAGRVTAPARVLGGPQEFGEMRPGDVLVASITTPAWTPLFAMAAGVVTDIGGPLSHSSIVAREYGIPAVLGTAVATRRISSGQSITVDGDAGRVVLSEADQGEAAVESPRPKRRSGPSTPGIVAGVAAGVAALTWAVRRRARR
jgi:phosphohistidine swiveling domain-containing protein